MLEHLRLYYTELLSGYPDVLTTQAVSKITGYGKTSINNWCNQGHIKSFRKNNVNHIPKVYLVEFFCSTYFRTITRKRRCGVMINFLEELYYGNVDPQARGYRKDGPSLKVPKSIQRAGIKADRVFKRR